MMVTRISKSRMSDEQIISAFLPDPKERARMLAQRELLEENGTLCFLHPNDAKGWKWVHGYIMTKHELDQTVEIIEYIECLPKPLSFAEFYERYDKVTRDHMKQNSNINPSIRLYTASDQTVATFYIRVPGGDWATIAPQAMDRILETHEFDYYVKIIEAWKPLVKTRTYRPGDATKLPRNEKRECLMLVARSKHGEVKRITYEIIRERPEDVF